MKAAIGWKMKSVLIGSVFFLFFANCYAQSPDQPSKSSVNPILLDIGTARSLKCTFDSGESLSLQGERFTPERAAFGSSLTFDSLNFDNRTARIVGNSGMSQVAMLFFPAGISFVEPVPAGTNMTTVYAVKLPGSPKVFAVTSRHIILYGKPIPSNYWGSCSIEK